MWTTAELELVATLAGWALDQDHDAQGMGDDEFLSFLIAGDDEGSIEEVRGMLDSILTKSSAQIRQIVSEATPEAPESP